VSSEVFDKLLSRDPIYFTNAESVRGSFLLCQMSQGLVSGNVMKDIGRLGARDESKMFLVRITRQNSN